MAPMTPMDGLPKGEGLKLDFFSRKPGGPAPAGNGKVWYTDGVP